MNVAGQTDKGPPKPEGVPDDALQADAAPLAAAEKRFGLREAARIARVGHSGTVARWILKGILAPDGQRVKLEAERVGGVWKTTAEALERFREKPTPTGVVALGDAIRGPGERERGSRRAERELEAAGW